MIRRLTTALSLFLMLPLVVCGQQRASIDVQTVTVAEGKKVTTTQSHYLGSDGRLVTEQHRPKRLISQTNTLGEMRIYNPEDNTVIVTNDKEAASIKELFTLFVMGRYVDMDLPQYGYLPSEVTQQEGLTIKTFVPKAKTQGVEKVELVFQRHLPICMVYYGPKGKAVRKLYFSKYEMGRVLMPMRVTEVEYTPPTDSLVRLSTYSNLLVGAEAVSEMFDFVVPADATQIALENALQGSKR